MKKYEVLNDFVTKGFKAINPSKKQTKNLHLNKNEIKSLLEGIMETEPDITEEDLDHYKKLIYAKLAKNSGNKILVEDFKKILFKNMQEILKDYN